MDISNCSSLALEVRVLPARSSLDPYINGKIRSLIISWLQVRVLPGPPISWNTNRRESPFEVFGVSISWMTIWDMEQTCHLSLT